MSSWLSTTSLIRPSIPTWLEECCQRIESNDPTLTVVELVHGNFDDHHAKYFAHALKTASSSSLHIHTMVISFRNLVDDGAQALAMAIAAPCVQQSIRTLQLRDCRNNARELTIFLQTLLQQQQQQQQRDANSNVNSTWNIVEFSLRHACVIDPAIARLLAQTLTTTFRHSIQEFRLTDSQMASDEAWNILVPALGHMERVYLIHNDIQNAIPLAQLLEQSNTRIRQLHLCENELSDDGMAILAPAILRNNTRRNCSSVSASSLDLLDLRSNHLTAESALSIQGMLVGVAAAAAAAAACSGGVTPVLKTLILAHNELGDLGAKALAQGLQQQQLMFVRNQPMTTSKNHWDGCLEHLDVSYNRIGTMGGIALAKALQKNKHSGGGRGLQSLNLSFNRIGDEGVKALAKALTCQQQQQHQRHQQQLRILHLRHNGITDSGAIQIAKYLPDFHSLKELVLSKNHIGETGSLALLRGLRSNVDLEYLETTTTTATTIVTTTTNHHHHAIASTNDPPKTNNIHAEMTRLLRLNKAGRRILRYRQEVPESTWAVIYERVRHDSDALFYFLTAQPPVVIDDSNNTNSSTTPQSPARKKTKL